MIPWLTPGVITPSRQCGDSIADSASFRSWLLATGSYFIHRPEAVLEHRGQLRIIVERFSDQLGLLGIVHPPDGVVGGGIEIFEPLAPAVGRDVAIRGDDA